MSDTALTPGEQRAFYDGFLRSRMLRYRLEGSARIDAAIAAALPYVQRGSRILDVGCGIGIAAERLARRADRGRVWACDLSDANIWYARSTVTLPNVEFFTCDVLHDFERLRAKVPGAVDLILLLDVIEHIPLAMHPELMLRLRQVAADGAALVLTYPTPAYQRYLRESEPQELQPIDEAVDIVELAAAARAAGFVLRAYSVNAVDRTNQYVHCAFQQGGETAALPRRARPLDMVRGFVKRYVQVPLRRRRFVDRVFGNERGTA